MLNYAVTGIIVKWINATNSFFDNCRVLSNYSERFVCLWGKWNLRMWRFGVVGTDFG